MNGADAIVSGTIAAVDPIEVPATSRVNGMMATTRMMKGVDRVALTTMPSTRLTIGAANSSPFRLVARKTPSGRPKAVPISAASPTMYRLSPVAWTIRLMSSGDIAETLRRELILREPGQRARRRVLAATCREGYRASASRHAGRRSRRCGPTAATRRGRARARAARPACRRPLPRAPGRGSRPVRRADGSETIRLASDTGRLSPITSARKDCVIGCLGWVKMSATWPLSTTWPASSTTTSSASWRTTDISWVISTMVTPSSRLMLASRSRIARVVCGSSAEVASSDSSTLGRVASARAMPTRCFWPPESSDG